MIVIMDLDYAAPITIHNLPQPRLHCRPLVGLPWRLLLAGIRK